MVTKTTSWDLTYTDHQVWRVLRDTLETIASYDDVDDGIQSRLDHIRLVLQTILEWEEAPSPMVSGQMLTSLQQTVSSAVGQPLTQGLAPPQRSRFVNAAYKGLDQVLEVSRGWPPTKDRYARGLIQIMQETARSAEGLLESLKEDVNKSRGDLESMQETADATLRSIEASKKDQLRDVEARIEQLHRELEGLSTSADQVDARLDSVVSQFQKNFTDAEANRQEETAKRVSEFRDRFDEELKQAQEDGQAVLDHRAEVSLGIVNRLEEHEKQAKNLVDAAAKAVTSTDYGEHADKQARIADKWRYISVGLIVFAGAAVVLLFTFSGLGDDTLQTILVKAGISIPFLWGAHLAIKEASRHRDEAEMSKDTQLRLLAIDPFIANMAEEDRLSLKREAAKEIFVLDRRQHHRIDEKAKQ